MAYSSRVSTMAGQGPNIYSYVELFKHVYSFPRK